LWATPPLARAKLQNQENKKTEVSFSDTSTMNPTVLDPMKVLDNILQGNAMMFMCCWHLRKVSEKEVTRRSQHPGDKPHRHV